jgi:SAM-dependent methyltransferase
MDVDKLYDDGIAKHYDGGADRGLFAGSRGVASRQIEAHGAGARVERILDFALGTGESLVAIAGQFPRAAKLGIDLSEKMIEIARRKVDVTAFRGDSRNAAAFVAPGSIDLGLMHFLLGYVEATEALAAAAACLRAGGLFSLVTSTFESFQKLHLVAQGFVSEEFIRSGIHTPEGSAHVRALVEAAGFDVLALDVDRRTLSFRDFDDLYEFGTRSGLFASSFAALTAEQIAFMRAAKEFFPFEDEYQATVVLARKR